MTEKLLAEVSGRDCTLMFGSYETFTHSCGLSA